LLLFSGVCILMSDHSPSNPSASDAPKSFAIPSRPSAAPAPGQNASSWKIIGNHAENNPDPERTQKLTHAQAPELDRSYPHMPTHAGPRFPRPPQTTISQVSQAPQQTFPAPAGQPPAFLPARMPQGAPFSQAVAFQPMRPPEQSFAQPQSFQAT